MGEQLSKSAFARHLVLDDPLEIAGPALEWYADKVSESDAVLVHLLSDSHRDSASHNAKAAWVAGLAYGMRRHLLMLAHMPFQCPTDYQTLLREHETAADCVALCQAWLQTLDPNPRRSRRPRYHDRRPSGAIDLRRLSLGEPVAENEKSRLDRYFVETSAFYEAQSAEISVFVGRPGTGKTAAFVALQQEFSSDRRNHVCTIQPVGYEVEGLLRLLSDDWHAAERGFLIESLWKFLIYSELAISVWQSINERSVHHERTPTESEFVAYMDNHREVLMAPFSQRLNRAVSSLTTTALSADLDTQRARISEHLHIKHIGQLRKTLGELLERREKVAILIDNLDHQWRAGADTQMLSALLLGLLRVTQDVVDDLGHQRLGRRAVNIYLTTFIRSDIFSKLEPLATQKDKWPIRRMDWNDPDQLIRIIDERLKYAGELRVEVDDIWEEAFEPQVCGMHPKDFLLYTALPRPRDVIVLAKEAMALAVNRNHNVVTEDDMILARRKYSASLFDSIIHEDDPEIDKMGSILFELLGADDTLNGMQLRQRMLAAGVSDDEIDFYINLMCDTNVLGIQTGDGFVFVANEEDRGVRLDFAKRRVADDDINGVSFKIHPAFHDVLEVASSECGI